MSVKCAWCGCITDERDASLTSHGICPECKKAFLENRQRRDDALRKSRSSKRDGSSRMDDSDNDEKQEMGFII